MRHSILVIDDEAIGAKNLAKAFETERPSFKVVTASTEKDIEYQIENFYFTVAIVDLRMDNFNRNGIDFIKQIIESNPFAKVIIMSAFLPEFSSEVAQIFASGRVIDVIPKGAFDTFKKRILATTDKAVQDYESNPSLTQKTLNDLYAEAKNESDAYAKGIKFEHFVSLLFSQIGFPHITKRFIDRSQNEVDLMIRNEIQDNFFSKFKQYILVECKNTAGPIDKNQIIQFVSKVEHAAGLCNLGIVITASSFKRTSLDEMIRYSNKAFKIIFLTNREIAKLIYSNDITEEFKTIIDMQVKDN
ncbi:response regulator [Hymenobacter sp. PAMC 26628]|uniref:response regulator n=1 Tax=Hymenobacter sp. PAMC 26628 TaxID=1484118 RepID=UPI00076FF592|nr:response regulator [Hymenobacter sp. PAMC 26628]AMJ65927.1 hypothetical protein AXW84_11170 [Hymenobacter sp. PAMC 26628]